MKRVLIGLYVQSSLPSWVWRILAVFRNGGIGREYKLKNPIWDLKWAAVLGGTTVLDKISQHINLILLPGLG